MEINPLSETPLNGFESIDWNTDPIDWSYTEDVERESKINQIQDAISKALKGINTKGIRIRITYEYETA